jgi:hypothetical protein
MDLISLTALAPLRKAGIMSIISRATTDGPDTELVALGESLQDVLSRLTLSAEVRRYASAKSGPKLDLMEYSSERFLRFWNAAKAISERNELDECDPYAEIDALMDQIAIRPARTIAGLRVKALAAIAANVHLWEKEDLDCVERSVRSLIEGACAITGVPAPQEAPDVPIGMREVRSARLN